MKRVVRGLKLFRVLRTPLVHVVGDHLLARSGHDGDSPVDHLWISIDPGFSLRVTAAVNTFSLRNRNAGFDPRVRVGVLRGTWEHLPECGMTECERFSYAELPEIEQVAFIPMEWTHLEQFLLDKIRQASRLEVWGTPYQRETLGVHQIHSRRASCAVPESMEGRDGALRLYFLEGRRMETLLLKFCGQ